MKVFLLCCVLLAVSECSFVDVTESAGIRYNQQPMYDKDDLDCYLDPCYFQDTTGGAAVADYDNDGWPDIYVTRLFTRDTSGRVKRIPDKLYRNQRDGTFEDVTAQVGLDTFMWHTVAPLFCDFDNDGDLDLYVTTLSSGADASHTMNRYFLFIYEDGKYTEQGIERGVAMNDGTAHLGRSAVCGDFNNDGHMDLFVSQWNPKDTIGRHFDPHTRLYRNRGNGYFDDITGDVGALHHIVNESEHNFAGEFVDFDRDGWSDLLVAADFRSSVYLKNTGGSFVDYTEESGCCTGSNDMGTTFGDLDRNGKLDWFLTSMGLTEAEAGDPNQICNDDVCGNRLYLNQSPNPMQDVTTAAGVRVGGWGWGAAFFDKENDGDLDIAMTNGHATAPATGGNGYYWENTNDFYVNSQSSSPLVDRTTEVNFVDKFGYGLALLMLDYDLDGDQDIFISHAIDGGTLLRNDINNNNNWIRVRTPGLGAPDTNYFGKGAQITVVVADGEAPYYQEMGVGSSLLGHSENTVAHFGLGSCPNGKLKSIEVWFPVSDSRVRMDNVPCNKEIVLREDGVTFVEELPSSGDSSSLSSFFTFSDPNTDFSSENSFDFSSSTDSHSPSNDSGSSSSGSESDSDSSTASDFTAGLVALLVFTIM